MAHILKEKVVNFSTLELTNFSQNLSSVVNLSFFLLRLHVLVEVVAVVVVANDVIGCSVEERQVIGRRLDDVIERDDLLLDVCLDEDDWRGRGHDELVQR